MMRSNQQHPVVVVASNWALLLWNRRDLLLLLILAVSCCSGGGAQHAPPHSRHLSSSVASAASVIRLNIGSDFEVSNGLISFDPQAYLSAGTVFEVSTNRPVTNVEIGYPELLYKTLVQSDAPFAYQIPVAAPTAAAPVRVRLRIHFSEVTNFKPGARIFKVQVEGLDVISALDVADVAGNNRAHVIETDPIEVSPDGLLDMRFIPIIDFPMVSGIEVITLVPEPLRFNFGSNESVSLAGGGGGEGSIVFDGVDHGDRFLSSGSGSVRAEEVSGCADHFIQGVDSSRYPEDLYRTRVAGSDFSYTVPVAYQPGLRLDILFHLMDFLGPGARVFAIEVDGDLVIPELDIAAEASKGTSAAPTASSSEEPTSAPTSTAVPSPSHPSSEEPTTIPTSTAAPTSLLTGPCNALVRRVRVFVNPKKEDMTIRFVALQGGEDAILNGLEVLRVGDTEPIRINIGSFETIDGGDGLNVFGSQASFMFEHNETYMPERGFASGDHGSWNFSVPPVFRDMNTSLVKEAPVEDVVPREIYESIAYGKSFRCTIPLPSWSYVNLRLHFRSPDDFLFDGNGDFIPFLDGAEIVDRTFVHQLERAVYSTQLGIRQHVSGKNLYRNSFNPTGSYHNGEYYDGNNEFIYVWEGHVQVQSNLLGDNDNNNALYLFFTSDQLDGFDLWRAMVAGIEIAKLDASEVENAMRPIRLYEGSIPYKDWINASSVREDFVSGPAPDYLSFNVDEAMVEDPSYGVTLYQSCLRVHGIFGDSIRYSVTVPSTVKEFQVILHTPPASFAYDFTYRLNDVFETQTSSFSNKARMVTNFAIELQDFSTSINPVVKSTSDSMLHIDFTPVRGSRNGIIICGIEILPYTPLIIRANPAAFYVNFAYSETLSFYSAEPALTQELAWFSWGLFLTQEIEDSAPQSVDISDVWESYVSTHHPEGLVQFYGGNANTSLIDAQWTDLYPIRMLDTFMSAMEFDMVFSFAFPVPTGAEFARVRLFFVEMIAVYLGRRNFHVEINDIRVLTDYTMHREGWGAHSLLIEEFAIALDNDRESITISFLTPPADESLFEDILAQQTLVPTEHGATESPTQAPLPASPGYGSQSRFNAVFHNRDSWIEIFGPEVDGPVPPPLDVSLDPYPGQGFEFPFGVQKPTAQINGIEILPFDPQTHVNGIRINCGGRGYSRDFLMDAFFSGENMGVLRDGGTDEMNTLRNGTIIRYAIPVPDDSAYAFVRLGFIEFGLETVGACDIQIEDDTVRSAFNVTREAGGPYQAIHFHEFVQIGPENQLMDIVLTSNDGSTPCIVSTIEVLPWSPFVDDALLLDAGQDAAPLSGPSYPFEPAFGVHPNDYEHESSGTLLSSSIFSAYQARLSIKNVPLDVPQRVFKSMLYGAHFSFKFEIPSSHCRVILHLADICYHEQNVESRVFDSTCGIRKMDVYLQGEMILSAFTAAPLTAYTKSFDVKFSTERVAHLRFDSTDKTSEYKFAFVNGIEIINLLPFTLNMGSSLYSDSLALSHYLLNTQEPRQWATMKDILNVQEGYTASLYQTLGGSKDLTYSLPCQPRAVLIRFHFCDITETNEARRQRIYINDEIVLDDFNPTAAALEDFGEVGVTEPIAYYWDWLHYRRRQDRKVKIQIKSQVPGVQAIISAIQLIPLFDNKVANFGINHRMKNLGTQNIVAMTGETERAVRSSYLQQHDVPVTGTHGFLIIALREIHEEADLVECDALRARLNTISVAGKDVLIDINVCELAGGYNLPYVWQGSAPVSLEGGFISVVAKSSRPYDYPIINEIETYSHYIVSESGGNGFLVDDDGEQDS